MNKKKQKDYFWPNFQIKKLVFQFSIHCTSEEEEADVLKFFKSQLFQEVCDEEN